jgi:hypothetical protein
LHPSLLLPDDASGFDPGRYYPPPCEVPDYFTEGLIEIGGYVAGGSKPRLRCQWGMDIRWRRGGRSVPRYVQSVDVKRIERVQPSGVVTIENLPVFFGDPHFIIEEWKSPESFVPPDSGIDPEKDWEEHRYQRFYNSVDYDPERGYFNVQKLLDEPVDMLGPFPRDGRYEYFCKLRPAGGQPSHSWLEVIKEAYARRNDRRFVSAEAEVADMVNDLRERQRKFEDRIQANIESGLRTHIHRMFTRSQNKGGSGPHMVILPGAKK